MYMHILHVTIKTNVSPVCMKCYFQEVQCWPFLAIINHCNYLYIPYGTKLTNHSNMQFHNKTYNSDFCMHRSQFISKY